MPVSSQTALGNASTIQLSCLIDGTRAVFNIDFSGTPELDPGIAQTEVDVFNQLGVRNLAYIQVTEEKPVISFSAIATPVVTALRLGKGLKFDQSEVVRVPKNAVVRQSLVFPGATNATQLGFGMAADQEGSELYVAEANGQFTEITRVDSASFNPASPNTFRQLINGAFEVSDDFEGSGKQLMGRFPHTVTSATEVDHAGRLEDLSLVVTTIQPNMNVVQITVPSCVVDLAGSGSIPLAGDPVDLQVRPTNSGGCSSIEIRWLMQAVYC